MRFAVLLSLVLASPALAGPRVAVVVSDELDAYERPVESFLATIDQPATVVNLGGRRAEADAVIRRFEREPPSVIFAVGAKAAYAVRNGLPNTPMVYAAVINPQRYGIRGSQVTGVTMDVAPETYLSQFVGFFPDVRTVGLLRGPSMDDRTVFAVKSAADLVGVRLVIKEVSEPKQVRKAYHEMVATGIDALWLRPDREILSRESFRSLTEEARAQRMPLLVETENMVRAGGLFAVVPDPDSVGAQAGAMALQILDGAAPAVLDQQDPEQVLVAMNLRTLERAEIEFDELLLDFVDVKVD